MVTSPAADVIELFQGMFHDVGGEYVTSGVVILHYFEAAHLANVETLYHRYLHVSLDAVTEHFGDVHLSKTRECVWGWWSWRHGQRPPGKQIQRLVDCLLSCHTWRVQTCGPGEHENTALVGQKGLPLRSALIVTSSGNQKLYSRLCIAGTVWNSSVLKKPIQNIFTTVTM